MKSTLPEQMQVIEATKSALLAHNADPQDFQEIHMKFSDLLKNHFEDRNIWLRFGLTIALSKCSPQSALQAFNECMRIDRDDPLPAMLAAKLLLEDLDEPEKALDIVEESIKRCKRLIDVPTMKAKSLNDLGSNRNSLTISTNSSSSTSQSSISPDSQQQLPDKNNPPVPNGQSISDRHNKSINPLLSKSYLLSSVTHAYIYEREPESIKQFKGVHLEESLRYLELALEYNPNDHLCYFHKSLHQVKQRTFPAAIDNLRRAIQISPHHIRSMQLLILTLSALKLNDEALVLCEAALHEFEDNLLLLYFKCNLEQRLVGTKGYKTALCTAQHMLKCLRRSSNTRDDSYNQHGGDIVGELSIWLIVAEIFLKVGSIEDAELCVDEASINASGALLNKIMFVRGLIAKAKDNLAEAKTFFLWCLALCPRHAMALQQVAHVHYLLGNYSTAEKFLKDSLDLDGDCFKTWHYLSLVLIELNQHDKAGECARKSTLLEESSPVVPFSVIPRLPLDR